MIGDGHLVCGPANPGEFVALSVLVMESDRDMRNIGAQLRQAVTSEAAKLGMNAVLAANPGAGAVLGALKEVTQHVAGSLKNDSKDKPRVTSSSGRTGRSFAARPAPTTSTGSTPTRTTG